MKAMLFIRETGATKFVQENGAFEDDDAAQFTGATAAHAKGSQMCLEGNVEAFEVWTLYGSYARTTTIEVQKNA